MLNQVFRRNLHKMFKKFDPSQKSSFEEKLILVNESDKIVGSVTKIDAHLKIMQNKYPHRAFSVFLFNQNNELLLQQRSDKKITFPKLWSNTCCSHPLYNDREMNEHEDIGIKLAAVRRMKFELGLTTIPEDYFFHSKMLYRAESNHMFEEFELDYILSYKLNINNEDFMEIQKKINKDEVENIRFIEQKVLIEEVKSNKLRITPWLNMILEKGGISHPN